MGILDPLIDPLVDLIQGDVRIVRTDSGFVVRTGEAQEGAEEQQAEEGPVDEETIEKLGAGDLGETLIESGVEAAFGGVFNEIEDEIVEELTQQDLTDLSEVEEGLNDAEGTALGFATGTIAAQTVLESASGGQIDSFETPIAEVLSFLALEDVLGTRTQATIQQAVLPSLEAEINANNRTQFANLQDVVERDLRNKDSDEGYIQDIATYGIREDNVPILEEVALEQIEFEELLETPAELGKIVPDDILEAELDRAGYAEPTKEFLASVNDEISRSNRVWEEKTAVESLVSQLDTLVDEGELSPDEAVALLPEEADTAREALRDRFSNIQDLPGGPPSRSQIESSAFLGFSDIETLESRLDRLEYDTDRYRDVTNATILGEIDGDLQQAFALGFIDEGRYGGLMDRVGLDAETQEALFAGQSLSDVAESRLEEEAPADQRPVSAIPGIGESRATALAAIGIETFADLAGADPQEVADASQVSASTAETWISTAQASLNQG